MKKFLVTLCLLTLSFHTIAIEQVFLSPEEFVQQQFSESPQSNYFWLTSPHKERLTEILRHKPGKLRIKYWGHDQRTAWILEEIGKEQPITVGITVDQHKITSLKVLIYRESRGHEVKQSFFTRQYLGSGLDEELKLENQIDGITGATLSFRALNKLARVALYLHQHSPYAIKSTVANNEKISPSP